MHKERILFRNIIYYYTNYNRSKEYVCKIVKVIYTNVYNVSFLFLSQVDTGKLNDQ